MITYHNIPKEFRDFHNRDYRTATDEAIAVAIAKLRDKGRLKRTTRYTSGGHFRDAKNKGSGQ